MNEINELLKVMKESNNKYSIELFLIEKNYNIQDSLIKLCLLLNVSSDNPHYNIYYRQFINSYKKLNDDKKERFKEDFRKIINKQKEINERNKIDNSILGGKK